MRVATHIPLYKIIAIAALLVCAGNAECVADGTLSQRDSLGGRWDVTFDIPNRTYRTILEFSVADDGRVIATTLGYPLLRFTEGHFTGDRLTLKGVSPFGAAEIDARLEGERLLGRWKVAALGGEVRGERDRTRRAAVPLLAVFDQTWATIDQQFYDPQFNGVDWQGVRARYRPRAAAARSEGELVTVIRDMLGELHSSHLNFSALTLEQSFPAAKSPTRDTATAPIAWRRLAPEVGYLQIKQFEESAEIIALVDRAFAELGDLPALIIDVRGNPGGTLSAAMRIGDHLFTAMRPVGYFATRRGLTRLKAKSIAEIRPEKLPTYAGYSVLDFKRRLEAAGAVQIVTGGRRKPYRGRVVLLIDQGCGSTTEGFAGVVKETQAATLIGRRTAGAMLSSAEVPIVGGWTLRLPDADFRTPGGAQVEGKGVAPDIVVQQPMFGDADLKRALDFIQENKGKPKPPDR